MSWSALNACPKASWAPAPAFALGIWVLRLAYRVPELTDVSAHQEVDVEVQNLAYTFREQISVA